MTAIVLIMGSAPDVARARELEARGLSAIVAINNAWRVRSDWTHLVYPDDFPADRLPEPSAGRSFVTYKDYVPANNRFGGVIYAGGTMAFNAGYWALSVLKPDVLVYCGCDMVYPTTGAPTHFYGTGIADPLRSDPTLQSLEAKANRLMALARRSGCLCTNLSAQRTSRLTFPRVGPEMFGHDQDRTKIRDFGDTEIDETAVDKALSGEAMAGCVVESGDYWNHPHRLDPSALHEIDRLWLKAVPAVTT